MSNDVFRALIADTMSTMSEQQLRNIILQAPDKDLGTLGAMVLAEKGKGTEDGIEMTRDVTQAEPTATVGATKRKTREMLKDSAARLGPKASAAKQKRKRQYGESDQGRD